MSVFTVYRVDIFPNYNLSIYTRVKTSTNHSSLLHRLTSVIILQKFQLLTVLGYDMVDG